MNKEEHYFNFVKNNFTAGPVSTGDMFQDLLWIPEATGSSKHHILYNLFLMYIHTYDKV